MLLLMCEYRTLPAMRPRSRPPSVCYKLSSPTSYEHPSLSFLVLTSVIESALGREEQKTVTILDILAIYQFQAGISFPAGGEKPGKSKKFVPPMRKLTAFYLGGLNSFPRLTTRQKSAGSPTQFRVGFSYFFFRIN